MLNTIRGGFQKFSLAAAATLVLVPVATFAQSSSSSDRWLHVRVIDNSSRGETVKVNVPLELAEKILPAVNKDRLHNGKVKIDTTECDGIDIHAILDAVRTSKDGEFVTVQGSDADVRVAKQGGFLLVHVTDKSGHAIHHHGKHVTVDKDKKESNDEDSTKSASNTSRVEVKVPMKVVDALFSAGKDEVDVLAALRALSASGDTELVSVKADDSTVRVWLDSKNISD